MVDPPGFNDSALAVPPNDGDDAEAARVFQLAADTLGKNHPRYADAIEALAETRAAQGMLEDALALGQEAFASGDHEAATLTTCRSVTSTRPSR